MSEPEGPILDETVLSDLGASVDHDRSFVLELIDAFLADGAQQIAAIDGALTNNDAEAMVRPAHTLKSSSATVGAMRLSQSARELEMAARSGVLDDDTGARVALVRAEWDVSSDALRAWMSDVGR